jgi:hypothetical protein
MAASWFLVSWEQSQVAYKFKGELPERIEVISVQVATAYIAGLCHQTVEAVLEHGRRLEHLLDRRG